MLCTCTLILVLAIVRVKIKKMVIGIVLRAIKYHRLYKACNTLCIDTLDTSRVSFLQSSPPVLSSIP